MTKYQYCYGLLLAGALFIFAAMTQANAGVVHPSSSISVEIHKGQIITLPRPAASVLIADPAIADIDVKSPTMLYVFGKGIGETTLYAMDEQERRILGINVNVIHNISNLRSIVRSLMPDVNVRFRSVDGGLVVDGKVPNAKTATDIEQLASSFLDEGQTLVNMMTVTGAQQVTLRLRVAEVARTELKQFGINLESLLTAGNFVFGVATGRDFLNNSGQVIREGDFNNVLVNYGTNSFDFNGLIDALEEEGFVSILAEPNLTSLSGKAASFLAGGEFPIPVVDDDGKVTIEFREYGVGLDFTPTVTNNNRINLEVKPEVSTLTQAGAIELNGFSIPALSTRKAETSIELESGQSFAIAGLLQSDSANDFNKFPGLGDVPILGTLFRSSRFERNETELVIIVTPYLVTQEDVESAAIPNPMEGWRHPTDMERLLLGKLYMENERPLTQTQRNALPRLRGPSGFIIE